MKRAGGDGIAKAEVRQPSSQFLGGLPCERDREHRSGVDGSAMRMKGDAMREHPCLTGPRSGQNSQVAGVERDGFGLGGVEAFEQVGVISAEVIGRGIHVVTPY